MSNQEFEQLLASIRDENPSREVMEAAAERVRTNLEMRSVDFGGRLNSCEDFRALAGANLSEERRMLVEDHLHSCVACRRYFRGERERALVPMPARQSRVGIILAWGIAAVVVLAAGLTLPEYFNVIFAPSGARASVASVDGELYQVSNTGLNLLTVGAPIAEDEQVRTGIGSRAVLKLRDGSLVELAERSDLRVSERWSGKMVTLERGSVMVEAAKQKAGYLKISTPDCLVSVKGTIFSVSHSLKGSRVSVVEGEVKVDKSTGMELLHRGDQTSTNVTLAPTTVAQDVAWSENHARYQTLLGEMAVISKKLDEIPAPAMRYSSRLTSVLPSNTAVFVSMPNLSATLAEADSLFEERAKESPAVDAWWNADGAKRVRAIVDEVRTVSDYLGDEVVIAVPAAGGILQQPVMVAEERKPGLKQALGSMVQVSERGNLVVMGNLPEGGGFEQTDFGKRIAARYASGAGWIFAANVEQIHADRVQNSMNVRDVIVERKQNLGRTENSATVSFQGERSGIASWIGAPAPMGTLDFISPDATFAASFVMNNPSAMLAQLPLGKFEKLTGVDVSQDIAATLGGEVTIAVDGPLLPTPGWKIALEVNDPARLEWSIEQMVKTAQQQKPEAKVELTNELVGGLRYYTLSSTSSPMAINYVFTDGFLLMAPNQNLLTASIQGRTMGTSLTSSTTFRAQLPQNGQMNFSALVYYNASAAIAPMAEQLTSTSFLTADQKKALAALTADKKPTLIYAYAEKDRIVAATRGSFAGLGLNTLVGLNGSGAGDLFSTLIGKSVMTGEGR